MSAPEQQELPEEFWQLELDMERLTVGLKEAVARAEHDPAMYAILLTMLTIMKAQMMADDQIDTVARVLEKQLSSLQLVAKHVGLVIPRSGMGPGRNNDLN